MSSLSSIDDKAPDPRMDGVEFSLLRMDGPFSLHQPIKPTLNLYFVRRGKVLFECGGQEPKRVILTANTCVALSGRIRHSFQSLETESKKSRPVLRTEAMGTADRGESVEIVVGCVSEDSMLYVRVFPVATVIFPEAAPASADSIRCAIDWIERESQSSMKDRYSSYIIRRMAEVISMEVGRFNLNAKPELATSMRAANTDKRIFRVLAAMYREPEREWTLQMLADEACMSRTGFAARYRELIGATPMQGLQRLRLRQAADLLINAPLQSVDQVAINAGFQSAAVFSRAFSREFGMSPGRWRHAVAHQ